MKNKNVYLAIGIIVILVVSIAAYIDLSNTQNTSSPSATSTPTATSSTGGTSTPLDVPITFAASGLDDSANSTVVISTVGGDLSYADLPFTESVASGTQVSFSFQSNVTTSVPDCLFTLSDAPSSNSVIVTAPTTVNATYGRAVIDSSDTLVNIPEASQINRIADSWPAHNTIIVMCGAGNKLVATSPTDTTITMFQYILPAIKTMSAPFVSSGTPNIEQLLADNPNIVFMSYSGSGSAPAKQSMVNAGLCVVGMNFVTFPQMIACVQQTGWILGPAALAKANAYISYFNQVIANITAVTSQIPQSQKLTVMHISGTSPLYVDGGDSLIDTWITTCGGIDAAASVTGTMQQVTLEQELSWNPDVILIGSASATTIQSEILNNPQYSQVNAVVNGKVIVNPMGVFDWSRYSVEEALNLQWVAQTLYPNLFTNINMVAQTKYFYQTFYGYTLSNDQVAAILSNTTPPPT